MYVIGKTKNVKNQMLNCSSLVLVEPYCGFSILEEYWNIRSKYRPIDNNTFQVHYNFFNPNPFNLFHQNKTAIKARCSI